MLPGLSLVDADTAVLPGKCIQGVALGSLEGREILQALVGL